MGAFSPSQAVIAAMVTPALLILASGSLIATALVRLARVVDRVRRLADLGAKAPADELRRHRDRALLAERAVQIYFAAVLCFVVAGFGIAIDHLSSERLFWLPVGLTVAGMALIVAGSAAMFAECRAAAIQIHEELRLLASESPPQT